jgi:hypothetical protein
VEVTVLFPYSAILIRSLLIDNNYTDQDSTVEHEAQDHMQDISDQEHNQSDPNSAESEESADDDLSDAFDADSDGGEDSEEEYDEAGSGEKKKKRTRKGIDDTPKYTRNPSLTIY